MSLSRQLLIVAGVSIVLGLGARVAQKQTVPFWGFPQPIQLKVVTPDVMGAETVSPDSAFAPSDTPYKIELSTAMGLFMKMKKTNTHFIDARDPQLYAEGHIPGAENIPFEKVGEYAAKLDSIPKTELVVCYCDGGDCHLSHDLAQYMVDAGWKRVAVYEGGWAEWSAETDFVAKDEGSKEAK
jgi:rhodanese-related sulfurtransferase